MTDFAEDPTTALDEVRALAGKITAAVEQGKKFDATLSAQLAERFQELDEWLVSGGDSPAQWADAAGPQAA